jgi:hypothetical protein
MKYFSRGVSSFHGENQIILGTGPKVQERNKNIGLYIVSVINTSIALLVLTTFDLLKIR